MDLVELARQVMDSEIRPSFVLALIERLPEDSMTVAQFRGGMENWREHFGWSKDRHMLADLFDVLQVNTEATGNWRRKPPELPRYPRPKVEKKRDKPLTVAEVYRAWTAKAARSEGTGVTWQG